MPESTSASVTRTASCHFAVGHKAADGHFPGNPIIPGAVLLREIVAAVRAADKARVDTSDVNAADSDAAGDEAAAGRLASRPEIHSAKFRHPVRPGDTVIVSWTERAGGEVKFSCSIAGSPHPAVTGTLRLASS